MIQPDFAQNPDELFDVVTEDGRLTGLVKRRADVHRDGDWHRAIHVWIHGQDVDGPFILYNLRSRDKDTMPLRLDVTVGGHLGAGETAEDAFREIHEEVGIEVRPTDAEFLFVRKAHGETERELQDVYLIQDDRPLSDYTPNPAELEALVKVPLSTALALFAEEGNSASADALRAATGTIVPIEIDQDTLLPRRYFSYYLEIAREISSRHGMQITPGA